MEIRSDGWEEGCVPAICKKCGAFGCACNSQTQKDIFFSDSYTSNANINGKWENPYVQTGEGLKIKGLLKKVQ